MANTPPDHPLDPVAVRAAEQRMLTPRNERRMKQLLDAICDPTRIKLVRALQDTTIAAGDLAHIIQRSRSATSQHLKVLRDVGAVVAERQGNVVRYRLSTDVSADIIEDAAKAFDKLQRAES